MNIVKMPPRPEETDVKIPPKPEEIMARIREGKEAARVAFNSLQVFMGEAGNAVLNFMEWQEKFTEDYEPLLNAERAFRNNLESYKKYGLVSSIQEMLDVYPISRKEKFQVTRMIDEKVRDWAAANRHIANLSVRMRTILVKNLMTKFHLETLDRIPCGIMPEMLEWLESYRFPELLGFGPLAAALARARSGKKISMDRAAVLCGVHKSTYARWEGGKMPQKKSWPAIAKFIGMDDITGLLKMQKKFLEGYPVKEEGDAGWQPGGWLARSG